MDYNKIRVTNPKLYLDGLNRGEIPVGELPDALQMGAAAVTPMVEGILGGPYPPELHQRIDPLNSNTPIGAQGAYPKPWRSAAQFIQDGLYTSFVGPYAKLVGVTDCGSQNLIGCVTDTCDPTEPLEPPQPLEIFGRIGLATSGAFSGQLTFYPQNWYESDEGTYNHEFWSNQFNLEGNDRWQNRKEWWESAEKITVPVYFYGQIKVDVEIAIAMLNFNEESYFQGLDLSVYNDYSLDMLVVMTALVAVTRWL
jgi:hypothetical protein